MKRWLTRGLFLALALVLAGFLAVACGDHEEEEEAAPTTAAAATGAAPTGTAAATTATANVPEPQHGTVQAGGPQGTLQFAVDAVAGDGIDSSAAVPVGSTQRVGLHLSSLGGISYQAYQIRLQYDDDKLDMVTPDDSWEANNEWPAPDGIFLATGPTVFTKDASGMNTVLVSVTANGTGSSYEGEIGFLDFLCTAPGSALLHVIPGAPTDTHLLDDDGVTTYAPAVVVDATISCGEGG